MALKKSVLVKLGLDDKEYTARLKAATTKLNTATNKMMRDGRRLSIASREIFMGLTLPMGLLGKNVLDVTAEMEKLRKGLTLIAQSRGIKAIDELVRKTEELAKLPGLGLEETFRGVQQLLSVGFGQNSALSIVEGLGIGIARAGGAAEEFDRVMRQVTQGIAKGKLEMQDFKTIFEQMPESRRILEDTFGPGMADLEKLRKRGVSVQEVIVAISDGFKDLGAGDLMSSLRNQLENLSDSWKKLGSTIGTDIFGSSFNNGIGKLSEVMDRLTISIRNMSPQTKQFIANFTVMITKVSVFLPLAAFMASRIKIMGAMLLKYSTLARGAALATGLLGTSVKSLGFARMLVNLRSVGKVGAIVTAGILGTGRAISFLGKSLKIAVPVLGELYIAYELLKGIFPNINKELKWMAQTIFGLAVTHFPALASAINWIAGKFQKQETGLSKLLGMSRRSGKEMAGMWQKPKDAVDDFDDGLEDVIVNLQKLSEIKLDRLGKQLGALSLGSGFTQTSPGAKIDPFPGLDTGLSGLPNTFSNVDEILAPFKTIKQYMEVDFVPQIWLATQAFEYLSQGIQQLNPVAGEFANILGQGFAGLGEVFASIPTGLKKVGTALGDAVKEMIKHLIALIAKLAIAAFLVNLIFPGGGGLGAFVGGSGSFGAGGANFGKGGFLKGILGGMGIPGLASGGIVTKPSIVALAEGGESEAVLPLSKLDGMLSNSGGGATHIRLSGNFRIQGRDLVYVLEENQAMVNSVRSGG